MFLKIFRDLAGSNLLKKSSTLKTVQRSLTLAVMQLLEQSMKEYLNMK